MSLGRILVLMAVVSFIGAGCQFEEAREVESGKHEEKEANDWTPPRLPADGVIKTIAPTIYYDDPEEFKKAKKARDRRLMELGRWIPKTEEELRIMMKRCRKSLEELGYKPAKSGIKTGTVYVCGHRIPPPYKIWCEPVEGIKTDSNQGQHYRLLVNGVTIFTTYPWDDCGWPYEVVPAVFMRRKYKGCHNELIELIKKINREEQFFTTETTRKEFIKKVKEWEKQFRDIECNDENEVIEVKVEVSKHFQSALLLVKYINKFTGEIDDYNVTVKNYLEPKRAALFRKPLTKEELSESNLKECELYKKSLEINLKINRIMAPIGDVPQQVFCDRCENFQSLIDRKDLNILDKYRKLRKFLIDSPECFVNPNQ